ncbi:MAG: hypothetical protein HY699_08895, partial [Deltaproteobacteria bacterium]|nr:hypothetical protein [Deltaproteobacteria bacterium]
MPTKVNVVRVALVVGVVLTLLTAGQSAAQGQGGYLPDELRRPFRRAMFTDANSGYVYDVLGQTVIIATADGGASWRLVMDIPLTQSPKASTAAFFLDGSTFWVLGDDGTLTRTTDGGRTFVEQRARVLDVSGRPVRLLCGGLFFRNLSDGWVACGDELLHTVDAGASWQRVKLPPRKELIFNIWFFNEREGMAVGDGAVRTDDGGQTWQAVGAAPERITELSCSRSGFCVVNTHGPLFASSDHGRTWANMNIPLKPGERDELRGFQAVSANLVVAVGRDTGETSQEFDRRMAVGGPRPPVRGLILKWDGSIWSRITHDQPHNFAGVFFVDANYGWFPVSENTIYKTTDGGQTLQFVPDYFRQIAALTPAEPPLVFDATPTPPPPTPTP